MPERIPTCPECNTNMELGFIPDRDQAYYAPIWVAGKPIWSAWFGTIRLKGRTKYPVATYRCPKCGYLKSYAAAD